MKGIFKRTAMLAKVIASAAAAAALSAVMGVQALAVDVEERTKEDILEMYNQLPYSLTAADTYAQTPSYTYPYSAGALSDSSLANGLNALNFMRYIAGLPADVKLSSDYVSMAQHACLVNAANGSMSHAPSQPANMSDDMYALGYEGASSSNLGWGYTNLAQNIVCGYMSDASDSNINRVGHRRWILYPNMQYTGFGHVGTHTAMYAFDGFTYGDNFTGDYVCWPAKNMPMEVYEPGIRSGRYPFSVNLGSSYQSPSLSDITVTVKSEKQNKTWTLTSANSSDYDCYLTVNNAGYGMSKCIIFNVGTFTEGDTVSVNISGLKTSGGESTSISYSVDFFSLNNMPVPAPQITSAKAGNGQVALNWTNVSCAEKYGIYTYVGGKYTCVGSRAAGTNGMYVKNLTNGTKYGFLVRAYAYGKWSDLSDSKIVYATPVEAKPKITAVTPYDGKVGINWTAVSGASKYAVYINSGSGWKCAGTRTELGMYVKNLTNGVRYGFAVKAYVNGAWTSVTSSDIVYAIPAAKPKITAITPYDGKVGINWTAVSGASKYAVYINSGSGWKCAGTRTELGMYVKNLTNGVRYGFAVKAYVNGAWTSVTSSDIVYATPAANAAQELIFFEGFFTDGITAIDGVNALS